MSNEFIQDAVSTPSPETGPGVCYRHPEVETGLRCNRCNKLICAQCAQRTPVGFRCPDCIMDVKERYYNNVQGYVNPYEQPMDQPFFTYLLIGLIVIIWTIMEFRGGSQESEILVRFGANYGPVILREGQFWRFFTSMFLHIGAMHLIFNSAGLFIFGLEMERIYGQLRYILIYILAGLFGSLASFAFKGPQQFSAGASGAIFGIVGMQLAFFLFYRRKMGQYGRMQVQRVVQIVIFSVIFGLFMPIDQFAHMGGLAAGFVLGYGLAPRYQMSQSQKNRGLVDYGALKYRWWVMVLGMLLLFAGTALAMTFWWGSWIWVDILL